MSVQRARSRPKDRLLAFLEHRDPVEMRFQVGSKMPQIHDWAIDPTSDKSAAALLLSFCQPH
jgi:hypothetical protein